MPGSVVVVGLDFIIIGAGMAGASVAANLAPHAKVLVLEAEQAAGYHSTGRSAALYSAIYGNEAVRALTRASRNFLFSPPAGFAPVPLVSPRDVLYAARADQLDSLRAFRGDAHIAAGTTLLSAAQAQARVPVFKDGYLGGGALETGAADIDVDALHQGFLRQTRAHGGQVLLGQGVRSMAFHAGLWTVRTPDGSIFTAPVVINASGAWGDELAASAGVAPVGLQAKRRTAVLIDAPANAAIADWPATIDVDEAFYFKPDAGLLLISPADETPVPPCDVQAEELDVAIAVDRFEQLSGQTVKRVRHQWAGLRVFSPDRTPVVGFDPQAEGFFWLVGQGGYGIQTAAAMGVAAAALARGQVLPEDLLREGVAAAALSPARFRR